MTYATHWIKMQHDKTHCFENAADLPQHLRDVPRGTQDQCADNNVHRLVFKFLHVLSWDDRKLRVGQMRVGIHALSQVLVEVRVGVRADHSAAFRVKLEVCPAATTDLQQAKGAVPVRECGHVSEKLSLRFVHFVIVRKCYVKGKPWE